MPELSSVIVSPELSSVIVSPELSSVIVSPELSSFIVSPELSSVRDYVITHSVHNDPWVESHMWPQQMWGQRSSRGQCPLVQVFQKRVTVSMYFHTHMWPQQPWGQRSSRGQWPFSHLNRYGVKSNITMIVQVCDPESRWDSWFENRLVFWKKGSLYPHTLMYFQIKYYNDCKSMWSRKQARLVVREPLCFSVSICNCTNRLSLFLFWGCQQTPYTNYGNLVQNRELKGESCLFLTTV